uniref:Uncharacterized protein n=1 Tax=Babesia bovis TaxID=5865 RepID=S6B0Q8_BABBO|nr:hypothetical protein [Babesia bovis]
MLAISGVTLVNLRRAFLLILATFSVKQCTHLHKYKPTVINQYNVVTSRFYFVCFLFSTAGFYLAISFNLALFSALYYLFGLC